MRKSSLITIIFSLIVSTCFAWGRSGHVIIGLIAEDHLSEKSKQALADILGEVKLSEADLWMDRQVDTKTYKQQANWHYAFKDKEFSDNGVKKIEHYVTVLKDPKASQEDQLMAIRVISHTIGDIHNPIHCAYYKDDAGHGAKVEWQESGEKSNLHKVWDTDLLKMRNWNDEQYTQELEKGITDAKLKEWQNTDVASWAFESQTYIDQMYDFTDDKLDKSYYEKNIATVDLRMSQAGIRLAYLLNSIFDSTI
ncbi:MAG: S1/P1 nuclease [Vicingaceae bacterium]